jgi:hypothetical protein
LRLRGSVFNEPFLEAGCITPLFHCWCVYYLETAVSVAQPFLLGVNTIYLISAINMRKIPFLFSVLIGIYIKGVLIGAWFLHPLESYF